MPKIPKLSQYLAEAEMDFDRDREREEDEGDEPEGEESHRHRLIPFPANATALDTEDYDWYKFGVAASDLDDADPKQFGQGDSDIIVVPFGNEDAERLLPLLKRTGIPLKRLGAEDRPEVTKESLADGYRQVMEYLKKVQGRWALVSKSTGKPLQYYRGPKGQRPSDEWVKGVERRVHSFEALGSVTEVNYPDELSVDEDLISRFTDKGWQIAGEGRDQIVLSKSGGRQVLKIVGQDSDIRLQTIKRYVEFFRNNQRNPHFPRVGFDKLLRWKDKIYYAYAQEALTHLSGDEAVLDYLENLGRSIAHNGDIPKNIPPGLTEEQVDGLAMSIEHLIERFGTESLDLGNVYNYMQRANGQIVIIDPLGAFGDEELHEGHVSEAFDQPYKLKWEKGDYGDVDAYAKLPDGNYLSIMFNKGVLQDSKEEAWSVEFFRNNSQEVTGEGDAQRVFATVLSAIQTFIKKYKPNRVIFSASKEVEPGQNAQSRANLYDRLVQRYANALGFKAFRADAGAKVHYELSRLKPVKEQFSEMEIAIMEGGGSLEEYRNSTLYTEDTPADPSRRGFLKTAVGTAAGAAMSNPIISLATDFVKQIGSDNIGILAQMLRVTNIDHLHDILRAYVDSGIMRDALTSQELELIQNKLGEDWDEKVSDLVDRDPNLDYFGAIEKTIGRTLIISKIHRILHQHDPDADLEHFFYEQGVMDAVSDLEERARSIKLTQDNIGQAADIVTKTAVRTSKPMRAALGIVLKFIKSSLPQAQTKTNKSPEPTRELPAPTDQFSFSVDQPGMVKEPIRTKTNEDAAGVGVVANKKQARDPRYVMSITKDVQPGEPARQAAKFGNKLDKNGLPPLLTDGIDIDQWIEYQLKEDASAGGTSAGSVAVVSAPLGSIFARDPMAGQSKKRLKKQIRSIYEFKMPNYGGDGDDGFSEETLKKLAAQWWNGDEDPKIEQVLALSGWEIGQDEGYDLGGAFVVQAGDVNGNSYMSWPAEELEAMAESKIFEAYGLSDPTYRDTNLKLNRYRNPNDPETGYDNDRFQSNLHKMNFELADIVDELIEKGIKPEVVVVDPDELYASQDWLNDHGSGEDSFYDYTDLPVVVRIDNEMYIADGHHRVSRAKSQGKKIRVYVFDKNKLNEGWREKIAAGALGAAAVLGGQQIDRYLNTDMATKPTAQQLAQKPATPREILEKTAKAAGLVGQEFVQFMAQCSHESLNFTRMTEIGTPQYFAKKYDKKFAPKTAKILGNKLPGDGELFKGRGFIQLTGRDNYMRAGKALGLDLVNNPDQAAEPNTAAKIAVWYWTNRVAPKVDSFHDTKAVTKKINPASKHLKQRQNQVQKMQMTYDEPTQPSKQGKV